MNGGQALVSALEQQGVRHVFGIPGAGQYEAVDALSQSTQISYISLRHEQAATYMADGYARASNEIAVALVVQGPGFMNAMSGMATAYAVSSPMLVVTGASHQLDLPEAEDRLPGEAQVTKWAARANRPAEIPQLVQDAFDQMKNGRPRPVAIEISPQIFAQNEAIEISPDSQPSKASKSLVSTEGAGIQEAAQLLLKAKRPVIWAGGGIHRAEATDALVALAEQLQIPVVTTRQGKGAISSRHPLCLQMAELRYLPLQRWLQERDLILAVGTRTDISSFKQPMIQINIDPEQLLQRDSVHRIMGDAKTVLAALHKCVAQADLMDKNDSTATQTYREVEALNHQRFAPEEQLQPQWDLMQAIRRAMPDDGILVQGMNQMGYYSRNYFPVYEPRSYLTASGLSTLGSAYPLALGAKVACPKRVVVALCGDGGFLYNVQELATAVQNGINAIAIVFNDNAYGNVMRAQLEEFDGHLLGTRLHNPDFVQLAEVFGAQGILAQDATQLEQMLREVIQANRPTLIEVPVGPMERQY